MPLIEGLYRQTSRNLLSTADTPSNEIRVSTASTITNIDQLKNQPWSEDENLIAYVPMLEVVKVEPNQYLGLRMGNTKGRRIFHVQFTSK